MRSRTILLITGGILLSAAGIAYFLMPKPVQKEDTSAPVQRQIEVADFDRLVFEGAINVNVTQGETPSVLVSGTEASLERLRHRVTDGVLYMELSGKTGIRYGRATTVDMVMPALRGLAVKGSGNVDIREMTLDKIALQINGAGNLDASGTCNQMTVGVSGAGNVSARNLKCHVVSAEMAGAGNMDVFADESVTLRLLGVGDIDVYGNPAARKTEKLGIGNITYHDVAASQ